MTLPRVACLILALSCLSPGAFVPSMHTAQKQSTDDKLKKLEKEPWMKPMLKVKRRLA